ncbi:MAG: LysR family transcriptional regulator [Eubacteriales bacterium]|nr:LysR family transcriptional regulator [Eubacterium sp.]MDY5494221.1 LysR family transcriptional regulator [Eubacteriales bacterium]
MNLLHMKYAVEIAETNSINKAADKLYVGQSALSRAIKELEASLGVTLFERSAKGMFLTADGEIFIRHAKNVLAQIDEIEDMFSGGTISKKHFSVSVPRASYIAEAFAEFSKVIDKDMQAEILYKETNSMRAVKNILQEDYKLGIIRYAENYDKYYKTMMDEKGLDYELITEFRHVLIMSSESPLAKKEKITYGDLVDLVEISNPDPYVPSLPLAEVRKEELSEISSRRIFVFERASQFELLSENPETYMWVSPVPKKTLERFDLVQRKCDENKRVYKDLLIHRKDYSHSELDNMFIEYVIKSKREVLK